MGITPSLKAQKKGTGLRCGGRGKSEISPALLYAPTNYMSTSSVVLRLYRKKPRHDESHHQDEQAHRTRYNKHTNTLPHQPYPVKQKYEFFFILLPAANIPRRNAVSLQQHSC
jgi:hypothetical protein